jgi:hypothetical protein
MVKRETGESGDDAYRISATLVHATLVSIVAGIVSMGGYMIVWALNDVKWKAISEERQTNLIIRVTQMEDLISIGILPRAQERIEYIEQRVRSLEARDRSGR